MIRDAAKKGFESAFGMSTLSAGLELCNQLMQAMYPEWQVILPKPRSIVRAFQWGFAYGASQGMTMHVFRHHKIEQVYGCFLLSNGMASEGMHHLTGESYWELMEYGKLPALFHITVYVLGRLNDIVHARMQPIGEAAEIRLLQDA